MSPIADYNLGRAHGRIVVDYDKKGTDTAQEEFAAVEEAAHSLEGVFDKLRKFFDFFSTDFVGSARKVAASLGMLSGGAAILLGMSRATGTLNGSLFKLRGGLAILGSLGILLGGVPKSVQNFPTVIKRIIMLSAAITLFAKSSRLMDGVVRQIAKFIGSTKIIRTLTAAFPALTGMISKLIGFIPSIKQVGTAVDGIAKPVHQIARLALVLGSLITLFRTGTKVAVGMAKAILKMGAGAIVIQGLIFLTSGLVDAMYELSGVLGLIPGLIVTAGLAAATLKVGFQGIDEALKNLNGTQEEFDASIKGLAPAAKDSMRALRSFRDEWKLLTLYVQQGLFQGVGDEIRSLGNIYLPLLRTQMGLVAVELNGMAKEFSAFFQRSESIAGVNRLFEMTQVVIRNLSRAVQPLLQAFMDIAIVSMEVLADLTMDAGEAAEAFANFIREARETGQLRRWIEDGITAMFRLGDIFINIAGIFRVVFDAFDTGGDGFLLTVNKMTDSLLAFLESAEGQEVLRTVVDLIETLSSATRAVFGAGFAELVPIIKALLPFIKEMAETFSIVLVAAIQILGPLVRGLAEALSFIAPVLGPILGFFLAWSIAMSAIGAIISILVTGIGLLSSAISSFLYVMVKLGSFIVAHPLFAALALLAAIAYLIISNWEVVGPKLKAIWEGIASVATSVWNAIVEFFTGIWDSVSGFFVGIWNDIASFAKGIWTDITDFFKGIWTDVTDFFVNVWEDVSGALVDTWNWIVETFRFIWEPIVDIITSIVNIIRDLLIIVFGGIAILFIEIWEWIRDRTIEAWNVLVEWLKQKWNDVVEAFHTVWDPIADFFVWLWDTITTATTIAWDAITAKLEEIWTVITTVFHTFWDPIAEFFTWLWETISTATTDAWNVLVEWLTQKWNGIKNFFTELWNGIANFFKKIWNSDIVVAFRDGVNKVVEFVKSIPGRIGNFVKNAGQWLLNAGRAIIEGLLKGIRDAFKKVEDFVGGIADWISDHKGPLDYDRKLLIPAGQAIMDGLLGGLESKQEVIQRFLESLTGDIAGGLDGATGMLNDAAGTIASSASVGIVTSLPSNAEAVASSPTPIGTVANGIGPDPRAEGGAPTSVVTIDKVDLYVTGNLDPTKPVEWRNAMKEIQEGLRKLGKDYPNE